MPVQTNSHPRIGLCLGSAQSPGEIVAAAQAAQKHGFDEIWLSEDYFYTGAVATAGAVLAHTSLPVGVGLFPTTSRHPALLAMELATLAGIYPGRLTAGIGVGVPEWLDQMGIRQPKPLTSVREVFSGLRTLLAGHSLDVDDASYVAREIRLEYPPAQVPALYAGVSGPRALRAAGEIADGVILSVLAGDAYVEWATAQAASGGASPEFDVVAYTLISAADDLVTARDRLREVFGLYLLTGPRNAMTEAYGIADEAERLAELPFEEGIAAIPDKWIDELAVVGNAQTCAKRIQGLADAGATSVCLALLPGVDAVAEIERLAAEVLPLVRGVS